MPLPARMRQKLTLADCHLPDIQRVNTEGGDLPSQSRRSRQSKKPKLLTVGWLQLERP